ncbi:hypothetical protein [Kaistia soli]|uniref:hypothetical protein n=1 Tax=Kaistia soli TaxID=446684 RepID=UPI0015880889|nr:hypothetical protein [Kaistia soli]
MLTIGDPAAIAPEEPPEYLFASASFDGEETDEQPPNRATNKTTAMEIRTVTETPVAQS